MRKRISKYKHLHSNRFRYLSSSIPLVCASGLLLVGGMMINPISSINRLGVDGEVYASVTTGGAATGGSGDETGDSTTTPSIVMGIDNSDTTLIGQVNSTSAPGSITRNMTITASNVDKYAVYVQSNDNNNGQLVGQASGGRVGQITSADGVVLGSIPDNTWGYALAEGENLPADNTNLKYKAVTSSVDATNPAYSTTTPEGTKKFTLAFGVKFADSANPDHYKADVLVSVAANPGEVTNIGFDGSGIRYMHELTGDICAGASDYTTGQLIDARDKRIYWVTKFKDGNCWMTQNLDYDDPDAIKVTDTSGLRGGPKKDAWQTDARVRQYWDPGDKIVNDDSSVCTAETDKRFHCILQDAPQDVDRHLLVGNYYDFQAVTKGTGDTLATGQSATESVCPTGWKLPTSSNDGDQYNFLRAEEINTETDWSILTQAPYYILRAGYAYSDTLNWAGYYANYAGATVANAITSEGKGESYISMFINGAISAVGSNAICGHSVRCLVLGS